MNAFIFFFQTEGIISAAADTGFDEGDGEEEGGGGGRRGGVGSLQIGEGIHFSASFLGLSAESQGSCSVFSPAL